MFSRLSKKNRLFVSLLYMAVITVMGFGLFKAVDAGYSYFFKNNSSKPNFASEFENASVSEAASKVSDDSSQVEQDLSQDPKGLESLNIDPEIPSYITAGTDFEAGEYMLISTSDSSYYKIIDGDPKSSSSIKDDRIFYNNSYVKVTDGQRLYLVDAYVEEISTKTPPSSATLSTGMYKVGRDIPEGHYTVHATGKEGNVIVLSSPNSRDIQTYSYFRENVDLTVKNGQYIILSMASISY